MDIFINPVCFTLFRQCHNSLVSHTEFVLVDQRSQILIIQIVHCCRCVTDSVYLQSCLFSLRMALVFLPQRRCLLCGILVVSAYDDFDYVRNAFTLGADDYILKPIAFLELKSHVEKIAAKLKSTEAEHSITDGQAEEKEKTAVFGMEEVTEYIRQHADEKLSAADLAKKMAVSYNSFGKLFKDHTQMSFSNYVLHYRMELAKEYLSDSSIKIKQVASKVGYKENPQHFSRDFTRQVGVSPKEYRENRN